MRINDLNFVFSHHTKELQKSIDIISFEQKIREEKFKNELNFLQRIAFQNAENMLSKFKNTEYYTQFELIVNDYKEKVLNTYSNGVVK